MPRPTEAPRTAKATPHDDLDPIGVLGNSVCDRIATHIARLCEPSEVAVASLQAGEGLALRILTRLAFINVACAATNRPGLLPRKELGGKTRPSQAAGFLLQSQG